MSRNKTKFERKKWIGHPFGCPNKRKNQLSYTTTHYILSWGQWKKILVQKRKLNGLNRRQLHEYLNIESIEINI